MVVFLQSASYPPNDGGLFVCLLIALIVGTICFLLFSFIRPCFGFHYFSRDLKNKLQKVPFAWIIITLTFSDNETIERNGSLPMIYLTWKRLGMIYCWVMTIITIPVLIPLYWARTKVPENYFTSMTASALDSDDPALSTTYIYTLIHLTGFMIILALFWIRYLMVKHRRDAIVGGVHTHCVRVKGIPGKIRDEDEIKACIEECDGGEFSGEVAQVRIVWDNNKLISLQNKRKGFEEKIEEITEQNAEKGKNKMMKPPVWKIPPILLVWKDEVDALEWNQEQLEKTKEKIEKKMEKYNNGEQKHIGMAHVTFNSADSAGKFLHGFKGSGASNKKMHAKSWKRFGPHRPEDIIWSNLNGSRIKRWIFIIILSIINLIFALLWTVPIALLSSLSTFEPYPGIGPVVTKFRDTTPGLASLVETFLPVILTIIVMALYPIVLKLVVYKLEKHSSFVANNRSIMLKFWVFVFLNFFILYCFFVSGLSLLSNLYEDTNSIYESFGSINWAIVGAYYMCWLLTAGIMASAIKLFNIPGLIIKLLKMKFLAKTEKKKLKIMFKSSEYKYHAFFAKEAVIFPIILLLGSIVPVVLPAGLIYYTLSYLAEKTVIINGQDPNEHRPGRYVNPFAGLLILGGLVCFPAWGFFFGSTGNFILMGVGGTIYILIIIGPIVVNTFCNVLDYVYNCKFLSRTGWMGPRSSEDEDDDEEPESLENSYIHPGFVSYN